MTPTSFLAAVWLVGPVVAIGMPSMLFAGGTLGPDTFAGAIGELSKAYVPYSGVVLAFVYRERRRGRQGRATSGPGASTAPTVVAVAASLIWNLVVLMPVVGTALGFLPFETALRTSVDLSGSLSWAVAPALGYFFGGNHSNTRTQQSKTRTQQHATAR